MNPVASLVEYLRSSKAELEKVAWPSRQDIIRYTTLIVSASVIAAVFFAALDSGLHAGISKAISSRFPAQAPLTTQTIPADALKITPEAEPVDVAPVETNAPATTNVITGAPAAPAQQP